MKNGLVYAGMFSPMENLHVFWLSFNRNDMGLIPVPQCAGALYNHGHCSEVSLSYGSVVNFTDYVPANEIWIVTGKNLTCSRHQRWTLFLFLFYERGFLQMIKQSISKFHHPCIHTSSFFRKGICSLN